MVMETRRGHGETTVAERKRDSQCRHCGGVVDLKTAPFLGLGGYPYCSLRCWRNVSDERRYKGGVTVASTRIMSINCDGCGLQFDPSMNFVAYAGKGFCSDNCADLYRQASIAPTPDPVNHPPHYTQHPSGVECIDITRHYSCMIGSAIKYLWRAGLKREGPKYITSAEIRKEGVLAIKQDVDPAQIQDLNKALWCIMEEIDRLGGDVTARARRQHTRSPECPTP